MIWINRMHLWGYDVQCDAPTDILRVQGELTIPTPLTKLKQQNIDFSRV